MRLVMFAVKDLAVQAFDSPQFIVHFGGAVRWFSDQVNNRESRYGQHPEDYELHELGSFDTENGDFDAPIANCAVLRGKDLVRSVS